MVSDGEGRAGGTRTPGLHQLGPARLGQMEYMFWAGYNLFGL